jgi:SOS-response transcriptional repressor LexA
LSNKEFEKEIFSHVLKNAIGTNRNISDFAKDCNVARPYISKFLNGKLEKAPSLDIIRKFASAAFNNVTEVDLIIAAGYKLDDNELFNLTFADHINEVNSSDVPSARSNLQKRYPDNNIESKTPIEVPVINYIGTDNIISHENIVSYEFIPCSKGYDISKCYYYICDDLSMINSRIYEGDIVFVIPEMPHRNNDIVLLSIDGDIFIRRYKMLNNLNLFKAENNAYDDFVFTNTELKKHKITILGVINHMKTKSKL